MKLNDSEFVDRNVVWVLKFARIKFCKWTKLHLYLSEIDVLIFSLFFVSRLVALFILTFSINLTSYCFWQLHIYLSYFVFDILSFYFTRVLQFCSYLYLFFKYEYFIIIKNIYKNNILATLNISCQIILFFIIFF